MPRRIGAAEFFRGDEFEKHAIVDDQAQPLARTAIGNGYECFTRGIDLSQLGTTAFEKLPEPFGVGLEVNAAMNQHFEPRVIVPKPSIYAGTQLGKLVK